MCDSGRHESSESSQCDHLEHVVVAERDQMSDSGRPGKQFGHPADPVRDHVPNFGAARKECPQESKKTKSAYSLRLCTKWRSPSGEVTAMRSNIIKGVLIRNRDGMSDRGLVRAGIKKTWGRGQRRQKQIHDYRHVCVTCENVNISQIGHYLRSSPQRR